MARSFPARPTFGASVIGLSALALLSGPSPLTAQDVGLAEALTRPEVGAALTYIDGRRPETAAFLARGDRGLPTEWADIDGMMRTAKHVLLLAVVLGG